MYRKRTGHLFGIIAGIIVAGIAPAQADDQLNIHILNRLAFGPSAADLAAIRQSGADAWIDRQLNPEGIAEPVALSEELDGLDTLKMDPITLFRSYGPPIRQGMPDKEAAKAARMRARIILKQAVEARFARAIYSRRQLQQVMVDFWYNHFNVFAEKGLDHLWVGNFEETAIRPYALGRFRDLLEATARHPAMLFYLDNWQNTAPNSPGIRGKQTGLNENYARELMELHTLGVKGGYAQADVVALARILTGWGIARPRQMPPDSSGFLFDPQRHDFGEKLFLGHVIVGSGQDEIEQALTLLAESPATARHLSFELAQYFVADDPPKSLVDKMTRYWLETGGDIKAVLQVLFRSSEFRNRADFGVKFKTPFEYVVSSVRATDMRVINFRPLFGFSSRMGEPIYGCQTPDGYKNTRDAWLNSDALSVRLSFATALGSGHMPLKVHIKDPDDAASQPMPNPPKPTSNDPPIDAERVEALLWPILPPKTLGAVAGAPPPLKAALIFGSPEFMNR